MPKNRHLLQVKKFIVMGFAVAFSYYIIRWNAKKVKCR